MRRSRPLRLRLPLRWLAALTVAALLGGGGWVWLRDSSLVRVTDVEVTGLSSSEGKRVRRALVAAAEQMTTLHVRHEELRAAVEPFASVASVRAQPDFPRGLAIEVTERIPVAQVDIAGQKVPVGAGGRLMRGVRPAGSLPELHATRLAPGGRITDPEALAAITALASAPEVLRRRVVRAWTGPKGLTLEIRSGPQLYFGGGERLEAKWLAAARVLAEPSAAGAVYLDVRVPERVAAGGLGTASDATAGAAGTDSQPQPPNPQVQPEGSANLNP